MTNLILPRRRKLLMPSFAAGLAAASPAMGHNGGPPITDAEVSRAVEQAKGAGVVAPWGTLPHDPTLAMLMMVKAGLLMTGGGEDAALSVSNVFATTLYTGTNSNRTITNGLDLLGKGGLVISKIRDITAGYAWIDTQRGVTKVLSSDATASETTISAGRDITGFTSSGYTLGISSYINASGYAEVSWSFRRAPKFFDVVTYTGNGSGSRALNHGLTISPGMVIIKRTDSTSDWFVYHAGIGADTLRLNKTDAKTGIGAAMSVSSTQFTVVGGSSDFNASGGTYVAYLFAHNAAADGLVQCGIATTGSTVTLGWQPQLLLLKNSGGSGDWFILDSARGISGSPDVLIRPNTSGAETSVSGYMTLSPTGFTQVAANWGSGQSFIYMAVRAP